MWENIPYYLDMHPSPSNSADRPDERPIGLMPALVLAAAGSLVAAGLAPLAALLIFAPVAEELVFRSGLQEALLRRCGTPAMPAPWMANVVTALAFAAAHLALRAGPAAALTVVPALACGYVYERNRRVAPCIALHALFNLIWLLAAGGPELLTTRTMP